MSISDGQNANAANFNASFVSKTDADAKAGNLTLNNKLSLQDSGSTTMTDAQKEINDLKDEFNTSTGHDHDGSDSKKVLATNLDTTGGGNGQVLKANGAGSGTWEDDTGSGGGGAPTFSFSTQAGDYTILDDDGFTTVAFSDTSSDRTCTLPTAADNTNRRLVIKNISTDKGKVTVDGESSEAIDGYTTVALDFKDSYIEIHCDGSNWYIVSTNLTSRWKNYTLTATGTGWTTDLAEGQPYRDMGGNWYLNCQITGQKSASSSLTLTLTGVTFKNVTAHDQPLAAAGDSTTENFTAKAAPNTGEIFWNSDTSNIPDPKMQGSNLQLESKPTFVE